MPEEPGADDPVGFAEKLLALLETAPVSTTYKYAVLLALIDAAVETADPSGHAYAWLLIADDAEKSRRDHTSPRLPMGSALTLDEFALWLNLSDVYWEREGRKSIEAVMFFGAVLSAQLWGAPFLREASKEVGTLLKHRAGEAPRRS